MKKVINWLKSLVDCGNYTEESVIAYGIVGNGTFGYANMNYMISRMDLNSKPETMENEHE